MASMQRCGLQPRAAAGAQGSRARAGLPLRVLAVAPQQHTWSQQQVRSWIDSALCRCSPRWGRSEGPPSDCLTPALLPPQGSETQRLNEQQNGALRIGADHQQQAAAAPAAAQPVQDATRQQRLQLHYRTQWSQPLLHHSLAGGEWRGVPMQRVGAQLADTRGNRCRTAACRGCQCVLVIINISIACYDVQGSIA